MPLGHPTAVFWADLGTSCTGWIQQYAGMRWDSVKPAAGRAPGHKVPSRDRQPGGGLPKAIEDTYELNSFIYKIKLHKYNLMEYRGD